MVNIPRAPFYVPRPSHENIWSGVQHSTKALLLVPYAMGNQFFYIYTGDNSSCWTKGQTSNICLLSSVTTQSLNILFGSAFYAPKPVYDPFWFGKPIKASSLYMPAPSVKPFIPEIWNFIRMGF